MRYVLEGSVRKAANRLRVTGQLIEASTGVHIWGHRFEGAPEDIFDLQDQITANVIGAVAPQLEQAEIERAKRKPTASLDAYDYYLQGMASYYASNKEAVSEALRLFSKAIGRDPAFASACGMAHGASSGARSMAGRSTAQERQQRPHGLPGVRPRSGLMMPSRFLAQAHALGYVVGEVDAARTSSIAPSSSIRTWLMRGGRADGSGSILGNRRPLSSTWGGPCG